jgi:hypothetical protein
MFSNQDIIVDDNLLSISDQEFIKLNLESNFFPWYIGQIKDSTSPHYIKNYFSTISKNIFEYTQFVHMFMDDRNVSSSAIDIPMIVYNAAKRKYNFSDDILRIKANLYTKIYNNNNNAHHSPHIDDNDTHWTMIYYVNSSDGDTFIFNESVDFCKDVTLTKNITVNQRISPKQGRCLIFKGNVLHAGMHPRNSDYRTVINFNFKLT